MKTWLLLVVALSTLHGPAVGEQFIPSAQRVSVSIEEDTSDLYVLDKKLECPGFNLDFYLGNTEPIPFEVQGDEAFFADVFMTRMPDSELGDELYEVLVVCDDGNPNPPPATATVTVTITSVNEYAPFSPRDSYSVSFSEANGAGQVVGSHGEGSNQYSVIDEDGGEDGKLTFSVLDDPPSPYFSLDHETGNIILLRELDYDVEGSLGSSLEIHVCDRATPASLCPNITINLNLTAVNDNDPRFLQPQYQAAVEEGLHRATELMLNISCTDLDVGVGGYEGMEVVSSTLGLVQLTDTTTGTAQLLLTAVLDYDFSNSTEFEVQLRCFDNDRGEAQRTDRAVVKIEVLPANDNSPQFSANWYNTSVLESLPVGSLLLTAPCTDQDRDFGHFKAIFLHQPSSAVNRTFSLEPATGQLTLAGTLDYEDPTARSHIFSIQCCDEGGLETTSRVAISTLPVSDEPLTLQTSVFSFTVDRLTAVDSTIGQVVATDGDQGEVPVIVYSLETNDLFEIDEEGYIVLTDYLSQDKGSFFNLSVEARDSQGPVEGEVHITVSGPLSIVEVINVVIGGVGVLAVVIIGVMVAVCSYFCLKLYRGRSDETTTEVPVNYMSGDKIPYHRPPSAHSRSSGGARAHSGTLRDRSTLSMKRARRKKKAPSFKKRTRQRPGLNDNFFTNSLRTQTASADDDMLGLNPADFEMGIFSNEAAVQAEEDELTKENVDDLEGEREEESTHNIFNPEDAGLMLGDIMLFPGEEQTRWGQEEEEEEGGVVDMGSWGRREEDESLNESESESEGGRSGEWDPSGSVEWDPSKEDENLLTFI